ncbi:MAG: methylmalonyl Co-A mutase-associated GTPase MeaB, partial [Rudaea sp.]
MADASLIEQVLSGKPTAVARAISRVERGGSDARELIRAIFSYSGHAHVVGVTGPPGTGKSTLVNELAKEFKRRGRRVAIIAVDPSSPFTGGAILGDRLRMQDLSGTGIFIRSMATRGQLGGLAPAVSDATIVLDAAGFDLIFVETVGAGQSEVDIARNAHTVLVLEAPGLGDDIQAIKAGILEIADVLVVNKADREGAQSTAAALQMNLSMNKETNGWRPPILKTTALRGEGISEVADAIEKHEKYLAENGMRREKERARIEDELVRLLQRELLARALARSGDLPALVDRVVNRDLDVYSAA